MTILDEQLLELRDKWFKNAPETLVDADLMKEAMGNL
jgi:hypothetical protein